MLHFIRNRKFHGRVESKLKRNKTKATGKREKTTYQTKIYCEKDERGKPDNTRTFL